MAHDCKPGEFYSILRRVDSDRTDIIFAPGFQSFPVDDGLTEFDAEGIFILPNVTIYPGTEESIRRNYYAWLAHAQAFQRFTDAVEDAIHKAIDETASLYNVPSEWIDK